MRLRLRTNPITLDVVDGRIAVAHGASPDLALDLGDAQLVPGLINAHDHLHRNHYPRLGTPPYPNAYAWGDDLHARYVDDLARAAEVPRRDALLFGAFKNLLGGATTVVHHDRWEAAFEHDFPVRVPRIAWADGLGRSARDEQFDDARVPRAMHIAEGKGSDAADEVRRLDAAGRLNDRTLAVHLVGVDADGIARLARAGAAVVWCPTSNLYLYGVTAPPELFAAGLDVLIGTDALVSGAGTLLDELRAAQAMGLLSSGALRAAVGSTASRRLGVPVPSLAPGARADIVALRKPPGTATHADVVLVLVDGRPVIADARCAQLFRIMDLPGEEMSIGSRRLTVAEPLASIAESVFARTPECRRIIAAPNCAFPRQFKGISAGHVTQLRRRGRTEALWPELPARVRLAAHARIESTVSAVLATGAAPELSGEGRACRALGVAAFLAGVGPLLGYWMDHERLDASEPVRALFKEHRAHARARVKRVEDELRPVIDELSARGIEPIWLKAAHTGGAYFPAPETRPSNDVDLALLPESFESAREVFRAAGFHEVPDSGAPYRVEWTPPGAEASISSVELMHVRNPWRLDVHRSLDREMPSGAECTVGSLHDAVTEPSAGPLRGRVLRQPQLTAYLAMHTSWHAPAVPLMRLVELHLVMQRDSHNGRLSWAALADLLSAHRTWQYVYPAFILTERLVPGTLDAQFVEQATARTPRRVRAWVHALHPARDLHTDIRSVSANVVWASDLPSALTMLRSALKPTALPRRLRKLLAGRLRWR